MRITNARHFLDEKGAIGPTEGPGLVLAQFLGVVIVAATQGEGDVPAIALCNHCGSEVHAATAGEDEIVWKCSGCDEEGVITNWTGTLWDMSSGTGVPQ